MPKRCNAAERRAFTKAHLASSYRPTGGETEPALGTLKERLDIICRRFGTPDRPRKPNLADEAFGKREREVRRCKCDHCEDGDHDQCVDDRKDAESWACCCDPDWISD